MHKKVYLFILLFMTTLFVGCGGGGSSSTSIVQGWHNQGKNCLACHNFDLAQDKHLFLGGTLYKDKNVTNQDDLNSVCKGDLVVLLENNNTVEYNSTNYVDANSKGYLGAGNIFILSRMLTSVTPSIGYTIKITDKNGTVLAKSGATHKFSNAQYDLNNLIDINNRISCNACHVKGGGAYPLQNPLYVNDPTAKINLANLCQ